MPPAGPPDPRSALAAFVVLGALLGFAAPAASQDALADKAQALREEAADYLKQHPVKQSSLFESAFLLIGTLAEFRMMSVDTCEYQNFPRDWAEALGPLRENSKTLLSLAYLNGETKRAAILPVDQAVVNRSLCAELKRHYNETLRQLKKLGPVLRKAGY